MGCVAEAEPFGDRIDRLAIGGIAERQPRRLQPPLANEGLDPAFLLEQAVKRASRQAEASADRVFGVPMFLFEGEQFWGYDRIGMLESRLDEAGLSRAPLKKSA